MHEFKFLARGISAAAAAIVAAAGLSSVAFAAQTVFPATTSTATAGSAQDLSGDTVTVGAGSTYTFFGIYSATGNAVESGLGVKVKFDPTKIASASVADAASGELMTKCMIAPPQVQTNQIVFGWIDTSVRTTPTAGAVAWPWGADLTGAGVTSACLSPNTPANSTAAITAAANLRLFRVTLTTAAGFTSGTTPIDIQADGNFSYASASPGFTNTSFTIQGAAAPAISLAATDPIVSRKTHGSFVGEIPISAAGVITGAGSASNATVEPRQATAGSPHRIVFKFTTAPTSVQGGNVTVAVSSGVAPTAVTTFVGNEMIVQLTGVTNGQRVQVTGGGINGSALSVSAVIGFLEGDVNNTRGVTSADITAVRSVSGATANATNFRNDLNVSGGITSADITAVRSASGTSLQ